MSRITILRRHPKRTLAGLAAVLAAVAVAVGSGADFTSTSSNATNTFTAGVLHHTNTASGKVFDNTASASFSGLKPGFGTDNTGSAPDLTGGTSTNYGRVVIANDSGSTETIGLAKAVSSAAGSNAAACGGTCSALSGALKVRIVRDGTSTVYDDTVSNLQSSTFDASTAYTGSGSGSSHTYDMYFYLPQSTGNAYQGGNAPVTFNWSTS